MQEVTITIKNLVINGIAVDDKSKFQLESSGDIRITADPTTVSAMTKYLKEVLQHEN